MEKLIELLNEYGEYDLVEHNGEICKWNTDDEGEVNIYTDYTNNIISKKFGFIKWLVYNDKIDYFSTKQYLYYLKPGEYETMTFDMYECVLIQLAISDNPIQDLISLLK